MTSVLMSGTFTSDGAARNIALPPGYNSVQLINITDIGSAAAATPVMRAQGTSAMAAGSAYYNTKTNGAATLDLEATTLTNGFTFFDSSADTPIGPIGTNGFGTAITRAANAQVTIIGHGLSVGDRIVLSSVTGMRQLEGMTFSVRTVVDANNFTLYMDTQAGQGFGAAATNVVAYKLPVPPLFAPRRFFIDDISQANPAVVKVTELHNYSVGDKVKFRIPVVTATAFGMTQLDGITAEITAITATSFTLGNIDSTAYGNIQWPLSASVPFTQMYVLPVGEVATSIADPERNTGFYGVTVGTTVQTTGKVYQYLASKGFSL